MKPAYTLEYLEYLKTEISHFKPVQREIILREWEYITNVEKFVTSHYLTCKKYINNSVGKPYMIRMYELLLWLQKNGEKIS